MADGDSKLKLLGAAVAGAAITAGVFIFIRKQEKRGKKAEEIKESAGNAWSTISMEEEGPSAQKLRDQLNRDRDRKRSS